VAIVYPEDGTSAIADGMALVKRAPNAAAGKAFIDWALSAATQKLVVQELGRRPIRKDAQPLAALKPFDQVKLVKYDIKNAADKRKEYMDKWQALVQSR
jgi:iron(III) transport system substrate-binding protein